MVINTNEMGIEESVSGLLDYLLIDKKIFLNK